MPAKNQHKKLNQVGVVNPPSYPHRDKFQGFKNHQGRSFQFEKVVCYRTGMFASRQPRKLIRPNDSPGPEHKAQRLSALNEYQANDALRHGLCNILTENAE